MHITLRHLLIRKFSLFLHLVVLAIAVIPVANTYSQEISVDISSEPLAPTLDVFAATYRIDIVYAQRQVEGRIVTCSYQGNNILAALECILSDQNLYIAQLRRRQFVLVSGEKSQNADQILLGTLHGFVSDGLSRETLPGAHVYLPELSIGAVTNEAGYYAIPSIPLGQHQVRISFLGFSPLDTLLDTSRQPNNIRLDRQILESMTILINSDRRERFEVEPGVRQIPMEQISKLPGFPGEADLLQSLRWFPSIQRVRTNQGGLVIRGGEPDQIQYLIDGVPVYHMWHVGGLLSVYQSEAFKDVRLYRGSFPAEHGGRLSGVLDAELKDGALDRIRGVAGLGLISGRLFVEGPITEKLSFMLSGRRSYLDQIIGRRHPVDNGTKQDTMRTIVYLYDVGAKVAWRPSPQRRLTLGVYGSADVLDIRLPVNLSLANASSSLLPLSGWLRPSDLVVEFDTRWNNYLISARYQYLYTDQLFFTTTAYGTSYRADERIFLQSAATSTVNSEYGVDILDIGVKLDMDYYFSYMHHIRAGISIVQREFTSDLDALILQTNLITQSATERSTLDNTEIVLYAQDTWKPNSKLQVQPGIRISQLRGGNNLRFSPRLGIRYDLDPIILRMTAGVNVQYLHQVRDRYSVLYDLISYRWVPASRSVDPSNSYHFSLGGSVSMGSFFTADMDMYIHLTRGLLLPQNETQDKENLLGPGIGLGAILGQYTRGQAQAHGLEFNLQYTRPPANIWVSYTVSRSRSRAPELGETTLRPSRYDVPHRLQVVLQRTTRRWTYGVSGQWRSGYPITIPAARYAVGDPLSQEPEGFLHFPKINNGRLPIYMNYGLQGAYQFKMRNISLQLKLEVNNLTFRRNITGRIFDPKIPESVAISSRYGFPAYPLLEITARF